MFFSNCIRGALKNRTRLLVTHQLHVLPQLDRIIVLRNSEIAEEGTYSQLKENNGELAQYLKTLDIDEDVGAPSDLSELSLEKVKNVLEKIKIPEI
jgi:ABC-type multidrug transport system ATPase subunit